MTEENTSSAVILDENYAKLEEDLRKLYRQKEEVMKAIEQTIGGMKIINQLRKEEEVAKKVAEKEAKKKGKKEAKK